MFEKSVRLVSPRLGFRLQAVSAMTPFLNQDRWGVLVAGERLEA
jgi:hypothetical protein